MVSSCNRQIWMLCTFSQKVENIWDCVCHGMGVQKGHHGNIRKRGEEFKFRWGERSIEQCQNYETKGGGYIKKLTFWDMNEERDQMKLQKTISMTKWAQWWNHQIWLFQSFDSWNRLKRIISLVPFLHLIIFLHLILARFCFKFLVHFISV